MTLKLSHSESHRHKHNFQPVVEKIFFMISSFMHTRLSPSLKYLSTQGSRFYAYIKIFFMLMLLSSKSYQVEMSHFREQNDIKDRYICYWWWWALTFCAVNAFWFVRLLTVFKPLNNLASVVRFLFISRPSTKEIRTESNS